MKYLKEKFKVEIHISPKCFMSIMHRFIFCNHLCSYIIPYVNENIVNNINDANRLINPDIYKHKTDHILNYLIYRKYI